MTQQQKQTALVPVPSSTPAPFQPGNLSEAMVLAERLAHSGLIPTPLRGKPDDVLVVMLTGHELELSPMQALRSIHVIEGKPVLSAELIVALCKRSASCIYFSLTESTDERATWTTQRRGEEPIALTFTIAQAKAANLAGKHNWKAYPAAMLRARAAASLARAVYQDLILGVAHDDEAEEIQASAARQFSPPPRPSAPPRGKVIDVEPAATEEQLLADQGVAAEPPPRRAPATPKDVERAGGVTANAGAQGAGELATALNAVRALPLDQRRAARAKVMADIGAAKGRLAAADVAELRDLAKRLGADIEAAEADAALDEPPPGDPLAMEVA
jgi:hypothetical protein